MKKITVYGLLIVLLIVILLAWGYAMKPFMFKAPWQPQSFKVEAVYPDYAHWADWAKFGAAFLAGFWLLWASFSKNTIGLMKTPLLFLAIGISISAVSYFSGCFTRSVLGYEAGTMSPETFLGMAAIPFIITAFVVLNVKVRVKLDRAREVLFWAVSLAAAVLMFAFAIIPSLVNPAEEMLIKTVKAVIDFGVLVGFVGAFRAMLVFTGGSLGYDWLIISIGAILLNLYFFYVMTPNIPNIDVFHWINLFWVGGFLATALGGIQLSFPDAS
jgi:hypothetical protein